ncbi:SUPPRESSOR OF AUXIN RESISTANCE1 [Raphanus sativus]|uniref:Nuclear pore complex protein NUP160 isoform X2 n=1 Tax=Raphanus sativus TaxID=3726 RepID=A0A6J0P8L7_RAPSA|nr:nuclear pore complex protein NUP160 isoform X2 [Raphanus sativus]KAJ4895010.1 SUPPRESSOR OF AUXIN RESISTANCE1 [Raphanus sativus]
MESNRRSSPGGMEVPVAGGGNVVKWLDISVPPLPPPSPSTEEDNGYVLLPSSEEDYASSCVLGEPPISFVCRINKTRSNVLDLLQLSAKSGFPLTGLRFVFAHTLSPFAFLSADEGSESGRLVFFLYALSPSGVVYVLKIENTSSYKSGSVFPLDHLIHLNVRPYLNETHVTSVAASPGFLFLGRSDGSVSSFQPASGFHQELRDDTGLGRLWGFVRGTVVAAVQDLCISEVYGRNLICVLHADGGLRVWDILTCSRVLCQSIAAKNVEGVVCLRLWLGKVDYVNGIIPLAVLYRNTMGDNVDVITVYDLHFSSGERIALSLDSGLQNISLEGGELRDVRFTSDEIWTLKTDELTSHVLYQKSSTMEARSYTLQEEYISEQLFLSARSSSHDLLLTSHSLFSSAKDQIMGFISSVFLRRLLCPGIFHTVALRLTLRDHNKHWTDSEFQSLSLDELKSEILLLVEEEVTGETSISVFHWWENFCSCYLDHWCNNNEPCTLLVQSDVIGLVRNDSVSLFFRSENVEHSLGGSSSEHSNLTSLGFGMSTNEHGILSEVLRCISKINKQWGAAPYAMYYESVTGRPVISSEEIVPRLVNILESGYAMSIGQRTWSDLGADRARDKELEAHKNLRTFSIEMLLSLSALCQRAGSWEKVFTIMEHYLQYLVPKKVMHNNDSETLSDICSSILVQATSQFAKVMFESAIDIFLIVSYLLNISGQVNMSQQDICKLRLELLPMIQDIVSEWLIILFFVTTPAQLTSVEDFSFKLSSLQIDSSIDRRSWNTMLGKCGFSLAYILLFSDRSCNVDSRFNWIRLRYLPSSQSITSLVQNFISWIRYSKTGEDSSSLLRRSTELTLRLIRNGQADAVERILLIVEASLRGEKTFGHAQDTNGDWCLLQHIRGCCLLDEVQRGACGVLKERKISDAIRCFFRASSGEGSWKALHSLAKEAGFSHSTIGASISDGENSCATWKLHYYEWAMQIFERYNISEGACQFAYAALEQVDEAINFMESSENVHPPVTATYCRGRLWANVFKFTLDLNLLNDAYCAIISNPDEEIKRICLRRFIIVLFECGKTKILIDGHLPFIGLSEKITQELFWKAGRSEIMIKPNPYKLLYAYEMKRHNWRMAASYMYQFSARLRSEAGSTDYKHKTLVLQERLNGLSAAINALSLVHPGYAWIDPLPEESMHYPAKKAKRVEEQQLRSNDQPKGDQSCIDIEKIQNEFVFTTAEYLLSLKNFEWTYSGLEKPPPDLVDLLVQADLYDMAFTVVLKFWRGSALKKELEKIFENMAIRCCPAKGTLWSSNDLRPNLMLTSTEDEVTHSPDRSPAVQSSNLAGDWEILEVYLKRYKDIHARLPVIVASTLLQADSCIELPLWLVHMFKDGKKEKALGMGGQEASPASLFQLYVDYGRLSEATNLLLEYMESFASSKPAEVLKRKKVSGVWFPYTTVERLWWALEKTMNSGRMLEQCQKLKGQLQQALLNHLKLLKVDSDDAVSSAAG